MTDRKFLSPKIDTVYTIDTSVDMDMDDGNYAKLADVRSTIDKLYEEYIIKELKENKKTVIFTNPSSKGHTIFTPRQPPVSNMASESEKSYIRGLMAGLATRYDCLKCKMDYNAVENLNKTDAGTLIDFLQKIADINLDI